MFKITHLRLYSLLILSSVLACHKADPTDGSSSISPVGSNGYQNCKIASETIKDLAWISSEYITLNGEKWYVEPTKELRYIYDSQGRLTQEVSKDLSKTNQVETTVYTYGPSIVARKTTCTCATPATTNSIKLNSQGYREEEEGTTYAYDKNSYLIKTQGANYTITYEIKDGNVNKEISNILETIFETTYTYDLTKPSLPITRTFYGKANQNLLLRREIKTKSVAGGWLSGSDISDFRYEYNPKGLVTRRIQINSGGSSIKPYPVSVSDYTYTCN
jgi:hypothetical protein